MSFRCRPSKDLHVKLPIAFEFGGRVFTEMDFGKPTGGVLADTKKAADTGDYYTALAAFVGGSVKAFFTDDGEEENDRAQLRILTKEMPFADVEWASIRILLLAGNDDLVEGMYKCPRCGAQMVCEGEMADKITDLPVIFLEGVQKIEYELLHLVEIRDKSGEQVLASCQELVMHYPTIRDCIKAFQRTGISDTTRLQYAVLSEAIETVDGVKVAPEWKRMWGGQLFEKMDFDDVSAISKKTQAAGQQSMIEKSCSRCGRTFKVEADTTSFFASGLRE